MKRLSQLLATLAVAFLVPLVASGAASAVSTCDIGYTGPDSNNMCTSIEKYQCSVTNTNAVDIKNSTNQSVYSGSVTVGSNTTGGSTTSGTATNNTGTTFSIIINNGAVDTLGTCTAAVVVPASNTPETVTPPATTTTSTQPSGGSGAIRSLPITSEESPLGAIAIVAGSTLVTAVLSAVGASLYRRFHVS